MSTPPWLQWSPPSDLEEVRAGLRALVEAVLGDDEVPPGEKRRLLREWLLWKWTESAGNPGKYDLRYYSRAAVEHRRAKGKSGLRHEHVFPRKQLAEEILAEPHNAASLLRSKGVACVVTSHEATALNASKKPGWQRYADAGVDVVDLLTGEMVDFSDPAYGGPPMTFTMSMSGPARLTSGLRHVRLVSGDGTLRRARLT